MDYLHGVEGLYPRRSFLQVLILNAFKAITGKSALDLLRLAAKPSIAPALSRSMRSAPLSWGPPAPRKADISTLHKPDILTLQLQKLQPLDPDGHQFYSGSLPSEGGKDRRTHENIFQLCGEWLPIM
jgi:hypothetical protein